MRFQGRCSNKEDNVCLGSRNSRRSPESQSRSRLESARDGYGGQVGTRRLIKYIARIHDIIALRGDDSAQESNTMFSSLTRLKSGADNDKKFLGVLRGEAGRP